MSWKERIRSEHSEPHLKLMRALIAAKPDLHFISEEPISAGPDQMFQVDLLFKEAQLVVEVDGEEVHDHSERQRFKTQRKREALQKIGFKVLNIPTRRISRELEQVLQEIEDAYYQKQVKENE